MVLEFRLPTEEDIQELAAELIPADRDEILAMGWDPEAGIRNSIATSLEVVAARVDGKLACITGVCRSNDLGGRVYPWLLSTRLIYSHKLTFMKYSQTLLTRWRARYPYMSNYVDQRHYLAVTWLRRLGAKLTPEPAFGPYKRPFYHFTFGEPDVY